MISSQLLLQRLRQRPQLAVGAAVAHGDARIEHVAQLAEDDALLVTAQRRERHVAARVAARGGRVNTGNQGAETTTINEEDPHNYPYKLS